MKDFYNRLLTDIQEYGKLQYKLLQVKGIEQLSRLIGVIITVVMITAIVVIGLIFLAIALAAWLEQWLPMWASYLVIAGATLLIAMIVYGGRILWFVRPIEKHLSEMILNDTTLLKRQKQSIDNQSTMQRELLRRDMKNIQQEWELLQRILQLIRGMIS
ncbi:MAG: phage holin family protein [Paludibacteraceae bacterium]|nr:phage holin family protein [Paludibacteraceae bacterium]